MECEGIYLLKFEFYNTDRKMKSIFRHIFISVIMHPNFMHFRQKISFKSVLEICTPVSGHLRTALNLLLFVNFNDRFSWCLFYFHLARYKIFKHFLRNKLPNFCNASLNNNDNKIMIYLVIPLIMQNIWSLRLQLQIGGEAKSRKRVVKRKLPKMWL